MCPILFSCHCDIILEGELGVVGWFISELQRGWGSGFRQPEFLLLCPYIARASLCYSWCVVGAWLCCRCTPHCLVVWCGTLPAFVCGCLDLVGEGRGLASLI